MKPYFRARCAAATILPVLFVAASAAADLSADDKRFLGNAAEGNNAEIELANLALEKTSRSDLKAFSRRIITDDQKATEQLKAIAAAKKVELPTGTGLKYKAEQARLSMLQGRDFEYAYVKTIRENHRLDLEVYQKEVQYGADADLKKFASMTIPILKQHISMAKTVQDKMATPE
jgi:putative membrane protein